MIDKLRSRGPIDIPSVWKSGPGVITGVLGFAGFVTFAALLGAVVYAGYLDYRNAIVIAMGGASFVFAFAVLSFFATREDL